MLSVGFLNLSLGILKLHLKELNLLFLQGLVLGELMLSSLSGFCRLFILLLQIVELLLQLLYLLMSRCIHCLGVLITS